MNKSNTEEVIGILWFILAVLLWKFGCSAWLWIPALYFGASSQIAAIVYAIIIRKGKGQGNDE